MICLYDVDLLCPYSEEMLDKNPDLCLYCEPDLIEFNEFWEDQEK